MGAAWRSRIVFRCNLAAKLRMRGKLAVNQFCSSARNFKIRFPSERRCRRLQTRDHKNAELHFL